MHHGSQLKKFLLFALLPLAIFAAVLIYPFAQGLYLPSRTSEGAGEIAVAIDTSGSIGQKELDEFASEVQGIIKDVRPSKLYVIYCDAQINHVDTFAPEDDVFSVRH